MLLLDEADRATLIDLLSKLEERREVEAPVVLTTPARPYSQGWGPNAVSNQLPAPGDDADVIDVDADTTNTATLGNGTTDEH